MTLAPSISWFEEERTNTLMTAGSVGSQLPKIKSKETASRLVSNVFIGFECPKFTVIFQILKLQLQHFIVR
jgi:hypothetical protein